MIARFNTPQSDADPWTIVMIVSGYKFEPGSIHSSLFQSTLLYFFNGLNSPNNASLLSPLLHCFPDTIITHLAINETISTPYSPSTEPQTVPPNRENGRTSE